MWETAYNADRQVRDGAWVAELTGMLDQVFAEHQGQVPLPQDQRRVQQFAAKGADHALADGVQPRRPRQGPDNPTPLFHTNMTPHGEIQLRTDRRLDLTDLPTT